jgi:hypothetical protein
MATWKRVAIYYLSRYSVTQVVSYRGRQYAEVQFLRQFCREAQILTGPNYRGGAVQTLGMLSYGL